MGQIAARIADGLKDIIVRSHQMFGYFKYLALYAAIVGAVAATRRRAIGEMVSAHRRLVTFLALYGAAHVLATAFYAPTSGTRTGRFVLAHVTPLLVLSAVLASPRLHDTCWRIAGCALTLAHFHLFLGVVLALDVIFGVWPRLITTYGGF